MHTAISLEHRAKNKEPGKLMILETVRERRMSEARHTQEKNGV